MNEMNANLIKNQDESKNLLESLKSKINSLSAENSRLKEREGLLIKELEDMNKKQKIMFSLEHKYFNNESKIKYIFNNKFFDSAHENKSETAATNSNTVHDFNKVPQNFNLNTNKTNFQKNTK